MKKYIEFKCEINHNREQLLDGKFILEDDIIEGILTCHWMKFPEEYLAIGLLSDDNLEFLRVPLFPNELPFLFCGNKEQEGFSLNFQSLDEFGVFVSGVADASLRDITSELSDAEKQELDNYILYLKDYMAPENRYVYENSEYYNRHVKKYENKLN